MIINDKLLDAVTAMAKISNIISNINDYQNLVDRNYHEAINKGTWSRRVDILEKFVH